MEQIRYRLSGLTWEDLIGRLAALRFRAAVVGPCGHGKTTLLEDLAPRLSALGFRVHTLSLTEASPRLGAADWTLLRGLAPRDFLLLDGAERLSRLAWLRVRRRARAAGGLVITTHQPGLLPTLHDCRTTPELLAGIVRDLLGPEAEGLRAGLDELFVRHQGNLRNALREIYDVYAGRDGALRSAGSL
ncbi:MAG TPA: hypothetical protein VF756_10880 [Thermoanaerobaculia bacterium]